MDKKRALKLVKPHLNKKRFEHTKRVIELAVKLAKLYQVDQQDAMLAACFHDYAKYRPREEMIEIMEEHNLPKDLLEFHPELWHGPVGSILVKTELGIDNHAVRDAIYWHTTGHGRMTALDKIIYLADYIEPERNFKGIDRIRKQATKNLDKACFMSVKTHIEFLLRRERLIYPETLNMYNNLISRMEELNL